MIDDKNPKIEEDNKVSSKKTLSLIALSAVFVAGIFLGRYFIPATPLGSKVEYVSVDKGDRQLVFKTFWDTWDELHDKFIGEITEKDLFYGAVSGMVKAAGDPYTAFSDPANTKQFQQTIEGSFSGVGVEIGMRNGLVTVISPLKGSPADIAGVRSGDVVVGINKEPVTQSMTLDDVVQLIRGRRGSTVDLTVFHEGGAKTEKISIKRDKIEIESVKLSIENNIAHLTITSFNSDTTERFNNAARKVLKANVKGIILDLRNNPGGLLQSSVEIASRFIPEGKIVVTEKGKKTAEYTAEGSTILAGIPIVILVNDGSASASEILAGALRDQLGIKVIGTKTFGKGSVQEFIKFNDGSSLRVTVAKWYTPSGVNINKEGIAVDVEVKENYETENIDEPFEKAKEELNKAISG